MVQARTPPEFVAAEGEVTLAGGTAVVDTGIDKSESVSFAVFLSPNTDGADAAADVRSPVNGDTYIVGIEETDSSIGDPDVEYVIKGRR